MNIQFSGVTLVKGDSSAVKQYLDDAQAKNAGNLTARADWEEAGIIISDEDTFKFLKEQGITLSDEEKAAINLPAAEAQAEVAANPEKYADLVTALTNLASDPFGFIDKVYQYASAYQEAGNKVEEVQV